MRRFVISTNSGFWAQNRTYGADVTALSFACRTIWILVVGRVRNAAEFSAGDHLGVVARAGRCRCRV